MANLPQLPPEDKYTEETWEWTIGRDFKDRLDGRYRMFDVAVCCVSITL